MDHHRQRLRLAGFALIVMFATAPAAVAVEIEWRLDLGQHRPSDRVASLALSSNTVDGQVAVALSLEATPSIWTQEMQLLRPDGSLVWRTAVAGDHRIYTSRLLPPAEVRFLGGVSSSLGWQDGQQRWRKTLGIFIQNGLITSDGAMLAVIAPPFPGPASFHTYDPIQDRWTSPNFTLHWPTYDWTPAHGLATFSSGTGGGHRLYRSHFGQPPAFYPTTQRIGDWYAPFMDGGLSLDASGQLRTAGATPPLAGEPTRLVFERYDVNQTLQASRSFELANGLGQRYSHVEPLPDSAALVLYGAYFFNHFDWYNRLAAPPVRTHPLAAYGIEDNGALRWRKEWLSLDYGAVAWSVVANIDLLIAKRNHLNLLRIDPSTGAHRWTAAIACPQAWIRRDAALAVSGDLAYVGAICAGKATLFKLRGMDTAGPAIALDQPALNGAWYAPYSNGQGFSLRFFPGSNTIFMPWFTFSRDGGSDTEPLRWYTLQGQIAAGAREASLPILASTGGRFAAPGRDQAVVGQARLRWSSCAHGLLEYRFDPTHNGGAEGAIALSRLLPPGYACTEADGASQPAQALYDPILSGHWFDPANAGQGLELQRIAASSTDAGVLFGTWFTYDPRTPTNEPGDQHWFTLQGQELLADGSVRSTIVQTLGGRFDSDPTSNVTRVGQADLLATGCQRLRLRYHFDDTAAAGSFRDLRGDLALHRLGDCNAP